jgi:phenylalanyl-tRNA synthetase beta chain
MLVSIKWLKDYIEFELTPEELAAKLTMAGLEVEALERKDPAFSGVVVAKILSISSHPNADKLSLCRISTGAEDYPVVCGAANIKAGDIVPLATVGATIPGGYTIKRSQIRGELSEGMLCSEEELGIGSDNTGIMILPAELTLGQDLAKALNLGDTVLDIGITPNRSDCLSIIGMAREIAALTGTSVKYPEIAIKEIPEELAGITSVKIEDPDLCPRYTARILKNVKIGPSPFWMKQRLEAVGLRAINNVVDVTNFVMMEFGQPLHAFDYRFLEEGRIVVRRSRAGEPFISLDGKERTLRPDTLMICDGKKPVAIGGIMGGLNSEVKDDTETILLESAYFQPSSIRKSARWLGMGTDAAFRFERGIDPDGVVRALNRSAQLIAETSGGDVCRGIVDEYPAPIEVPQAIPLRIGRVNGILGSNLDEGEIVNVLINLGMTVSMTDEAGTYRVDPPSYRVDISREIDLIEEVARLVGYDQIELKLPQVSVKPLVRETRQVLDEKIRQILNGCGFSEVIHYSFITPKSCELLKIPEDDERSRMLRIANPLTDDQAVMRTTLVYSLLDTMRSNANNGCYNLKIFETGKIFIDRGRGEQPFEKERLGGVITGLAYDDFWHLKEAPADFFSIKGVVEDLFDALRLSGISYDATHTEPFLHPGRSCTVSINQEPVGLLGELHPDVQAAMDLRNRALVFELDMDALCRHFTGLVNYREVSKYPAITRDVAFLIRNDIESAEIMRLGSLSGEELLEKINVFDIYIGGGIPEGMKSLGVRFSYRSPGKTLKDEEVNEVHRAIVSGIVSATGAKIRGENN